MVAVIPDVAASDALIERLRSGGERADGDRLEALLAEWRDTVLHGATGRNRTARSQTLTGCTPAACQAVSGDALQQEEAAVSVETNTAATPARDSRPTPLITCSGCDETWTAPGAAHCTAAYCHRTFSSVSLFDKHRSIAGEHGTCHDPARLTGKDGTPVCEFRDGMWRFPPMDEDAKSARFGGPR